MYLSEEYLDFVNSVHNDVFAFLISGPGITGPYNSPPGFPGGAINIVSTKFCSFSSNNNFDC